MVKVGSPDAEKLPTTAFELPLPQQVLFIVFWAVPAVSVAFDSEPARPAGNHKIDPPAVNCILRLDDEAAIGDLIAHVLLEEALIWLDLMVLWNTH